MVFTLWGGVMLAQSNKVDESYKGETILNYESPYSNAKIVNGKQETHEVHKTVYVKKGEEVTLKVPHANNAGDDMKGYFRWFDYNTNIASTSIKINPNYLKQIGSKDAKIYLYKNGLVRTVVPQNNIAMEEVIYTAPSNSENGVLGVIACDVSTYRDFEKDGEKITREPTMSVRYIYTIMDAEIIANEIDKATNAGNYYEEYEIYIPASQGTRIRLQYSPSNYFCWNNNNSDIEKCSGLTWYKDDIKWDIYDNNDNKQFSGMITSDGKDNMVVTVRYKVTNQNIKNIARYKIHFIADVSPLFQAELNNSTTYKKRTYDYLNENYILAISENFDDKNDLKEPVYSEDNVRDTPLSWEQCTYGYTYEGLMKNKGLERYTPIHSEYGLYKSALMGPYSKGSPWVWYPQGSVGYYDRRYYDTNGKEFGYFFYVDASDEAGTMAKLPLNKKLCSGTTLTVTAWVCDISTGNERANVDFIFKGISNTGNGEKEVTLNKFNTGYLKRATNNTDRNWQQVYYTFSFKDEVEYDRFLLQIDNNCTNTSGADYAIDDIRVYMTKPTVQALQSSLPCSSKEANVKAQIEYNRLLRTFGETEGTNREVTLYYKFLDEDKQIISDYNYGTEQNSNYERGTIKISTTFNTMKDATGKDVSELPMADCTDQLTWREGADDLRYVVFRVANDKQLKYNQNYYLLLGNAKGEFNEDVNSPCAMISEAFMIHEPARITADGGASVSGAGVCYGSPLTLEAVLYDRINGDELHQVECRFDWFFGENHAKIYEALTYYRKEYPSSKTDTNTKLENSKGNFTEIHHAVLEEAIATHSLYLNQKKIVRRVAKGEIIKARPIPGSIGEESIEICNDAIQLDTTGETAMPDVEIGQGLRTQVVRMSLAQAQELIEDDDRTLWIPVHKFKNSDGGQEYEIVQSTDNLYDKKKNIGTVYLCGSNDPVYKEIDFSDAILPKVAQLKTINIGPDKEDYLVFSFNDEDESFDETKEGFKMKEGFTYSLMFFYNEKNKDGMINYSVCNGMSTLDICIVPKYLTWTGAKGDNWNNDGNWKRSTKTELYKTDYTDYTGEDLTLVQGFVPMHNSLATIANTATAPWLYKLETKSDGSLDIAANTNHPGASSDYNVPTKEIEYELEVWKGSEVTGETAKKHNFAGALFRGNSCEQIYFKPGAETRNTQYLIYDKAHVEFELTNNRWYMLASPLKSVYAGDMYIPTAGGRQVTEAFQNITYQQGINNRFDPAVYQRSWSKDNAVVWKKNGSYTVNRTGDWSGAFNKVDIQYSVGTGFSIRPIYFENKQIKEGHTTLFRLPKEDTSYSYYEYGDNNTANGITNIERGGNNGKLATDTETGDGSIQVKLTNIGNISIFLAGNPFMATLDMDKFFEANSQLQKEYSILTAQGQCTFKSQNGTWESDTEGFTGGSIAPMQGFFVITKEGTSTDVTYKTDMTIAKPADGSILLRSAQTRSEGDGIARLYATAERNGFQSHILIAKEMGADNGYNEEEDAATIIDSNLKDQPTLYSVADSIVTTINFISDQKRIPLGIYSENNEDVALTFSGADSFSEKLFLYDAQNQTYSEIDARSTFTVPGNTHGRYFLSLGREDEEGSMAGLTAYSPEAGRIVIVAPTNDPMTQISVYNTLGMEVQRLTQLNSTQEEVTVPAGLYIVRIESREQQATVKVAVKNR